MDAAIRTYIKDDKLISTRRSHIAKCATKLFFGKGYDRVTTREIAEASGMGIGSFYRYVGSKEDVLYLVIEQIMSEYVWTIEKELLSFNELSPTDAIKQAIEKLCQLVDRSPDMVIFAYQEIRKLKPEAQNMILVLDRRITLIFEEIIRKGCNRGEFTVNNIRVTAQLIVSASHLWAVRRGVLRRVCTLDEYINEQISLTLNGISHQSINNYGLDQRKHTVKRHKSL